MIRLLAVLLILGLGSLAEAASKVTAVRTAANGEVVLAGWVAADAGANEPADLFVTRFSADGGQVLFHRVFPGASSKYSPGLGLDAAGNAYLTGVTDSDGLATTAGAWKATPPPLPVRSYLVKLDRAGEVVYSTYLFGDESRAGVPLTAVRPSGEVVVAAKQAEDTLVTPGHINHGHALLLNIRADGSGPDWVARSGVGVFYSVMTLDPAGNIYLAGTTYSDDIGATPGAYLTERITGECFSGRMIVFRHPCSTGYVAKLDPEAKRVHYVTYLSGSAPANVQDIAADAAGNAYVTGNHEGHGVDGDFPVTEGGFQTEPGEREADFFNKASSVFVTKLSPDGDRLVYSTLLTGDVREYADSIAVTPEGAATVTGLTFSPLFPTTGPWANHCGPVTEANRPSYNFVTRLNADGSALRGSAVLYGSWPEVVLDAAGTAWSASSRESGFPRLPGAKAIVTWPVPDLRELAVHSVPLENEAGIACVANGASFLPGRPIAPGQLLTLFGAGIGPEEIALPERGAETEPLELAGIRVLFNGQPAPILAALGSQINVVTPSSLQPGRPVDIRVERDGIQLGAAVLPAVEARPIVMRNWSDPPYWDFFNIPADAWTEDGHRPTWETPAERGSVLTFYATGLGLLSPISEDGSRQGGLAPRLPLRLQIGHGNEVEILDAATVPGRTNAVVRFRARVPETGVGGFRRLQVSAGSNRSEENGPPVIIE